MWPMSITTAEAALSGVLNVSTAAIPWTRATRLGMMRRLRGIRRQRMQKSNQILAAVLHGRECPFGYQCMATDCVECVKIRMENGGAEDGKEKMRS